MLLSFLSWIITLYSIGGLNYLLSTAQACEFEVYLHDVTKCHGGKNYIHDGEWIIPMKFDKDLICVPIREPTNW